jgi:plasmid maintenance system antidote protein VapI
MPEIDARQRLQDFVDRYKNPTEAARAMKITPQYMRDLLHNKRDISPRILEKLGLKRVSKVVPQ